MWRSRNNRDGTTVVCIACGTSLPRSEAREYDKQGNRWERHDKSFEHLCKECYRGLCHQPRDGLEALLVDVERAVDSDDSADLPSDTDRDHSVDSDSGSEPAIESDSDSASDPNLPIESDAANREERRADRADDAARSDDTDRTFLAEYFRTVEERSGPTEEPGHES